SGGDARGKPADVEPGGERGGDPGCDGNCDEQEIRPARSVAGRGNAVQSRRDSGDDGTQGHGRAQTAAPDGRACGKAGEGIGRRTGAAPGREPGHRGRPAMRTGFTPTVIE